MREDRGQRRGGTQSEVAGNKERALCQSAIAIVMPRNKSFKTQTYVKHLLFAQVSVGQLRFR